MSATTGFPTAWVDQTYFENLANYLFKLRKPKEHFYITLSAEQSQFVRFNAAQVRQSGVVEDALLEISMLYETPSNQIQKCNHSISLTGFSYEDQSRIGSTVEALRKEIVQLPADPFAQLPKGNQTSSLERKGRILREDQAVSEIVGPTRTTDIAGIYAAGSVVRAMASSAGQRHWFLTENFSLDYSLYTRSQKALKGTFAGNQWNRDEFARQIRDDQYKLSVLERESKKVPPGSYRCYLAPAAVGDLIHMFNWGCISEASIQQGDSALRKVRTGEKSFSSQFNLSEDFRGGEVPRFNSQGELAPEQLLLIENGKLLHSLISARTAKEYRIESNHANDTETLRAPSLAPGDLAETEILKKLGTGLYLSNLHYLNWSDQPGGRITGMTRYACFWVENGEITSPIENLRFDDSLFNLFGQSLESLTASRTYLPDVGTYYARNIGGVWSPGALISKMKFTL